MLYPLGRTLTYWLACFLFRIRYVGLENIPQHHGFILAANHRSNFDPIFIAQKIRQPIYYMAKSELFRTRFLNWLLRSVNAFPVARGTGDTSALDTARQRIEEGGVLGMFPEGKRSKDGTPLRARSGVAIIAGQTSASVLPCAIKFGEKLRFRCTVTIQYGKLIPAEELGIDPASPATIRAGSKRIMADIVAMLDGEWAS